MPAFNVIILSGVFIIVALLVIIVVFPEESRRKKKKEKSKETKEAADNSQEWETKVARLEKHISTLKSEVEAGKTQEAKHLKELALEQEKVTTLEEKLAQEKQWLNKEEEAINKRDKDILDLKNRLLKSEVDFEREYSARLRLDQQLKEIKQDFEGAGKEKREMALKVVQLEAELKSYKEELLRQKKISAELSKKNDETAWVAKAEYDRVAKLLQEKERELNRISQNGA